MSSKANKDEAIIGDNRAFPAKSFKVHVSEASTGQACTVKIALDRLPKEFAKAYRVSSFSELPAPVKQFIEKMDAFLTSAKEHGLLPSIQQCPILAMVELTDESGESAPLGHQCDTDKQDFSGLPMALQHICDLRVSDHHCEFDVAKSASQVKQILQTMGVSEAYGDITGQFIEPAIPQPDPRLGPSAGA